MQCGKLSGSHVYYAGLHRIKGTWPSLQGVEEEDRKVKGGAAGTEFLKGSRNWGNNEGKGREAWNSMERVGNNKQFEFLVSKEQDNEWRRRW